MNASPHTHKVELISFYNGRRHSGSYAYDGDDGHPVYVRYGDTLVKVASGLFGLELLSDERRERRIRKATAKAIAKHDKGSVKAGVKAERERRERERSRTVAGLAHDTVRNLNAVLGEEIETSTGNGVSYLRYLPRNVWGSDLPATATDTRLRVVK